MPPLWSRGTRGPKKSRHAAYWGMGSERRGSEKISMQYCARKLHLSNEIFRLHLGRGIGRRETDQQRWGASARQHPLVPLARKPACGWFLAQHPATALAQIGRA